MCCSEIFHHIVIRVTAIVLLALVGGCNTTPEVASPAALRLVMESVTLSAQFKRADGSVYTANLDGLVVRPDDGKSHPLVVLNHAYNINPEIVYADSMKYRAVEFARRGWVTLTFSRRGFGFSKGDIVEKTYGCTESELIRVGLETAADIREAIRLMAQKSYVDASKIISVGVTDGGYASLALTADPPTGLAAAILFSPGRIPKPTFAPCFNQSMTSAVAMFGKTSRVPTLWIQAENNLRISLDLEKQLYKVFVEMGGNAEFITVPAFETDGNDLFSKGFSIWTPYVDVFLQKTGLRQRNDLIPISPIRRND
jgi:dienelactone hydrolase